MKTHVAASILILCASSSILRANRSESSIPTLSKIFLDDSLSRIQSATEQATPQYYEVSNERYTVGVLTDPHPQFPQSLKRKDVTSGYVLVSLSIDQEGHLEDWLPLESNDRAFVKELSKVIGQWSFYPPTEKGIPTSVIIDFEIGFRLHEPEREHRDTIYQASLANHYAQKTSASPKLQPYRCYSPREIDRPIRALFAKQPSIPKRFLDPQAGGEAVFEFFIDSNGFVRLLSFKRTNGKVAPEALEIIYQTIENWVFERPLLNGNPVTVKAIQRISVPAAGT